MRVIKGLLFVHPSMGLGVVTGVSGSSASVYFESYPGKSYLITLNYIKTVYSYTAVEEQVKSVKDIIRKDLLDGFFNSSTKAKGHEIFNKNDAIYIFDEKENIISANVIGTKVYETKIIYENGVVSMFCDCPVDGPCKHLFALIDYIKHNDDLNLVSAIDDELSSISSNAELEKLLNIDMPYTYTLEYIDIVNNIIKRLRDDFSGGDIANYFINHKEILATTQQLHHRIFFINNEIYEKIRNFLILNSDYKYHSMFLYSLDKNHDSVFESINSRYYVSDILKRRDNHILYTCFNSDFNNASRLFSEPSFYHNSKVILAYYLEDIYKANPNVVKEYLRNVFIDDFDIIYQIYTRSNDEKLKKTIYLSFVENFRNLHISRDDIESIDILNQIIDKKQRLTMKQRGEFLRLIDECISSGHEREVVTIVFNDWISARNSIIDDNLREEIISKVSDNQLLIKILKAKRGYYDYY